MILTNRPFWSVPTYYNHCVEASQNIERLVLLLESNFGLGNITYLMGYCIYTGASAILGEASKGSATAHATLRTFLRALNTGMRRSPLLGQSLNIIVKGMHNYGKEQSGEPQNTTEPDCSQVPWGNYIPAFPYLDSSGLNDFDFNSYMGAESMGTSDLTCYPEALMDFQLAEKGQDWL